MKSYQVVSLFLLEFICFSDSGRAYKNLYKDRPFDDQFLNLMNTSAGIVKFMREGEEFMFLEPPDWTPVNEDKFDFIVIGAGTAGATIASRLSEIPSIRVLLIEAGRSENLVMEIPLMVQYFQFSNDVNWKYRTESSEKYCRAMTDNSCAWPRGKVMGGSSVLNYLIATRGHPKDYDRWAELGNVGWSWKDVLPYFKKLEAMDIDEFKKNKKMHNDRGPVNLNYPTFHTPLATAFLEAGSELGYKNIDYNGENRVGFSYLQVNIKNGTRMSSSRAYLHPARERPNLKVTKNSLVTRLLFESSKKKVIGVEFIKRNRVYRVYVTKEVILSAGAIGSPQILMLSGIGPAKHLKDMGINPIVDAPVGENLMDHIAYGGLIFQVNQPVGITVPDMVNPLNPYIKDFLTMRTGPLTIPGGCEAIAFMDTERPDDHSAYPNIEQLFISSSFATIGSIRKLYGISDSFWNETYRKLENTYTWTIYPMILRPKSRGKILLRSRNINSKPRIYPNYMSNKEDVRVLISGIRAALKISKTVAFQKYGSTLLNIPFMGCEEFEYDSDEFWECGLRTLTLNIYHYSGTCKMGPKSDPSAVVDSSLKVYGIKGIRVVDASIFPELMSGHPNIPIFMIGEKLSDMIKQEWGYPTEPLY